MNLPRATSQAALVCAAALALFSGRARAQLTYPPLILDGGLQNDPLVHAGYLDVTRYGADPTGANDSTSAIQNAINDGMSYAMVTYLPSGTYLVSAPLVGEEIYDESGCQTGTNWGNDDAGYRRVAQAPTLVGPANGTRPILELANGSAAFQDPTNPQAIIDFYLGDTPADEQGDAPAWSGNPACQMQSGIRDLDIEVGNHNPGAIGAQNPGTQGCFLENIHVDATGGYAGFRGVPGQAEMAMNLEVVGGQYGVIPYWPTTLVGITVSGQTVAGVDVSTYNTMALVGFSITEPAGVAAIVNQTYTSQRSQVALIDGTITITGSAADAGAAIQDYNGHDLYVSNVYAQTPGWLIQSGSKTSVAASGAIDQIAEYVYTNPTTDDENGEYENSFTLLDGVFSGATITNVQTAVAPATVPSDLIVRHLPGQLPWIEDPGVVDVTTLGADPTFAADSTAAIQQAINQGTEVFLPRGDYKLSGTLQLNPNTRLFGTPGMFSRFYASVSWNPNGQYVPFIQSASTTTGATYLGDFMMFMPNLTLAQSYLYGLDWQAGRSSIVRQIYAFTNWKNCPSQCGFAEAPRDYIKVEGSGGGRWYGLQISQNDPGSMDPATRLLAVSGTSAPLTFYAPNPEHTPSPMVEIDDASNVRFLGSKVEGDEGLVQGSNNVMVAAYSGHDMVGPGASEWAFIGDSNVAMAASSIYAGQLVTSGGTAIPAGYLVYEASNAGADAGINEKDNVSFFEDGTFDETQFPYCGDGVCDGAETSANCPADCSGSSGSSGGASGGSTGGGSTSGSTSGSTGTTGSSDSWTACRVEGGSPDWSVVPGLFMPYTDAVIIQDAPVAPTSNAELSATVQTAWDATNLYVRVQVTQPDVVDNPALPNYYTDAVELYLDGTDSRTTSYGADDFHFTVNAFDRASPDGGYSHSAALTDAGYVVDFTVPLATLGANAGAIGFDVAVDDNPDGGPSRASQLMWSGDGDAYQDPQQFGTLTLSDTACTTSVGTSSSGGSTGAMSSGTSAGGTTSGGTTGASTTTTVPSGTSGSSGGGNAAGGCGCSSAGKAPSLAWILLAVIALRRRRR